MKTKPNAQMAQGTPGADAKRDMRRIAAAPAMRRELKRAARLLAEWQRALGAGDRPDLDRAIAAARALLREVQS